MLTLLLLASLLVSCYAQQYTCNFVMRDPAIPSGYVNGKMVYDYAAGRMLNTYTTTGNNELFQYDASSKAGKYVYKYSASCSCTVSALATKMPVLSAASGAQSAAGVSSVTFASGFPASLTLSTGRVFTYSGCTSSASATLLTPPTNCDCGAPLDVVLVLDRSCSISTTNFGNEKQFTLDLIDGFTYSPTQVNLGITNFHVNTWDGPVDIKDGYTEANVVAGANAMQCYPDPQCLVSADRTSISSGTCCGCGTCISCGIINGADMLKAQHDRAVAAKTIRVSASKVLVVLTDGYHNKVVSPFLISSSKAPARDAKGKVYGEVHKDKNGVVCNEDQTQTLCVADLNADLQAAVNYAQATVPGVIIYAIGVGAVYADSQLLIIAQGKSSQVFATRDWGQLTSLVAGLVQQTCQSVPGTTCDSSCCGFCDCKGSCVAPDGCDASNICLTTTITGPCCKSTVIPPPGPSQCQGTDKCYTYNCDQTLNGGKGGCTKTLNPVQANTTCAGYTCDPATGLQVYTNLCPCKVACKADADCPGKTSCNTVKCVVDTADSCNNHCQITDISSTCNKGDKCYTDSCDPTKGCLHVANAVTPDTQCTTYKCDPATGKIVSTDTSARCQLGDKCYTDSCDAVKGCLHVANPVTADTQCTSYKCDPKTGAIVPTDTSARCQLGDKCYTDSCDAVKGCLHVANPVTADTQCTTYKCDPKTGAIVPTDTSARCQLGDKCYTDACDPKTGCSHVVKPVTPNTQCTTYKCNPATGSIESTDISGLCQKGDKCYTDACDPVKGCSHVANPVPNNTLCTTYKCNPATGSIDSTDIGALCQKGDKCYTDACDPVKGCSHVANPVTPDTKCTTYKCNPATGVVSSTDIGALCQLGDKCYTDACDPVKGCSHVANPVPANTACANFACVSPGGTIKTTFISTCILCTLANQAPCDDKNLCTTDACVIVDPADPTKNTCTNTPIPADSCSKNQTDLCYTYVCDPIKGCTSTKNPVPDSDMCDQYACNPKTGLVVHTTSNCTANNTDMCKHYTCDRAKGCVFTTTEVPASDACVQYACNPATGKIDRTVSDCVTNNTNLCKVPSCDVTKGCVYTDVPVPASDACQSYVCNPTTGKVESTVASCGANDTNKCNTYTCNKSGGCVKTTVEVPASDACQKFFCNPTTGLVEKNSTVCDTSDKCKTVTCDITKGCVSVPVSVPASTACAIYTCDPKTGTVSRTAPDCIGNLTNKCKKGSCDPAAGCVYTDVPVPASDACNQFVCNPDTGAVTKNTTDCSKGSTDKCVQFTCDAKLGCSSKNTTVPPSDKCNKYVCNPTTGKVDYTNLKCSPPACVIDSDCNDRNACTDDSCYWPDKTDNKTAVCKYVKKPANFCDDKNACTIDICVATTTAGQNPCTNTPLPADFCNDNNACTIDTCNATSPNITHPCSYKPIKCERLDICNNPVCDPIRGCLNTPVNCPKSDNCTIAGCNTTKNTGCYIKVAGNCTPPPPAISAALAGGAVAGIVIAAIAAATLFGGGAGYAFVAGAGSGVTAQVLNNPLYKPEGNSGNNPIFKA